ncbi:MAG TPA: hypothetical protein VGM51_13450 [Armatimonadota bacterium]|jgi:hypothetical protein
MRKYIILLGAAALFAAPRAAHAYVAVLNETIVRNADTDQSGTATVGDLFTISNASFSGYTPCQGDPVIGFNNGPNDLGRYLLNVDGVVASVSPDPLVGPNVHYGGSYFLYYDQDGSGAFSVPDYRISSGTISIDALFDTGTGAATLNGTLDQILGPEITPPFANLGPQVIVSGTYIPNVDGPQIGKIINGTLTRACPVPEPGSLVFLAGGLLPLLGLRRRK